MQLTYNNHFYNICCPHDKTTMLGRRARFHKRNIASNPNAISYRLLTNRNDPVLLLVMLFLKYDVQHTRLMKIKENEEKKENVKCESEINFAVIDLINLKLNGL
jgi:hypothetical protein